MDRGVVMFVPDDHVWLCGAYRSVAALAVVPPATRTRPSGSWAAEGRYRATDIGAWRVQPDPLKSSVIVRGLPFASLPPTASTLLPERVTCARPERAEIVDGPVLHVEFEGLKNDVSRDGPVFVTPPVMSTRPSPSLDAAWSQRAGESE